ncbi:hypothetical protein D3C84_1243390 [compost metagenome]
MLRPEGGGQVQIRMAGDRIQRMGQVGRDRGRMRQQGQTAAFQLGGERGFGQQAVDAEFHESSSVGRASANESV